MLSATYKNRKQVDSILIDTYSTQNFYYAFLVSQLARLYNIPYIPILHGGNLVKRLKHNKSLSHFIFHNAKYNVAPSVFQKHNFETYGYNNIVYIPNALEIGNYKFKQRDFNTINLLWVRSFSKLYNPELAVKLLKALLDKGIAATLTMIGPDSDGSLQHVKNTADTLGVEVEFTGKLTKTEWTKKAESCNVFINTTNFDNMPVSVIEAMALGLPVLSTNVGGMPYLIDEGVTGKLVNPNDVDAFVDAVFWLKNNTEKAQEMAFKARQKVDGFDWNIIKQQWLNVLNHS